MMLGCINNCLLQTTTRQTSYLTKVPAHCIAYGMVNCTYAIHNGCSAKKKMCKEQVIEANILKEVSLSWHLKVKQFKFAEGLVNFATCVISSTMLVNYSTAGKVPARKGREKEW